MFRLYCNKQRNTIRDYAHTLYTEDPRNRVAGWQILYRGPPPALRPEARGDNGEGDDESGEDGWTAG